MRTSQNTQNANFAVSGFSEVRSNGYSLEPLRQLREGGTLMRLTSRYVHPTPHGGHCRVRIYLPDEPERDAPVVICSELSNNPGMSITQAAQTIAAEVIRGHRLPTPLVWIEHYPAESRRPGAEETFDLAIFSSYEITETAPYLAKTRLRLGEATWKPLDRHSVEVMIGQPLR